MRGSAYTHPTPSPPTSTRSSISPTTTITTTQNRKPAHPDVLWIGAYCLSQSRLEEAVKHSSWVSTVIQEENYRAWVNISQSAIDLEQE